MELYSSEHIKLKNIIKEWTDYPDRELEATFGKSGKIDATTFINIARRLRSKGYEPLPQEDYMNIITPTNVRITLQSLNVVQQYCRDDTIQGKPFHAIIKDRTGGENVIDIEEYDVRVKIRRENTLNTDDSAVQDIIESWQTQPKAFRVIRRWSFQNKNIRVDMSIVRSSIRDSRGQFRWVKTSMKDILNQAPQYEVEVELLRNTADDSQLVYLINGIGEVLRAIQKNTLLIRNSVKDRIINEYNHLNESDKFRGVNPVTLETKNMIPVKSDNIDVYNTLPNIRSGYNVTDKADGLRVLAFCDSTGELYLIDMSMTVYRTGLQNPPSANCILDGEFLQLNKTHAAINQLLLFDIYKAPGNENVSELPFTVLEDTSKDSRLKRLQIWISDWKNAGTVSKYIKDTNKLQVSIKQFQFASTDPKSIFVASSKVLDVPRIYNIDGLIFTPTTHPLPQKSGETFYEQFKWKPIKDNTIDFLVNYEKDPENAMIDRIITGIHPDTGETLRYKILRLYVGSIKDPAFDDPRRAVLEELPLPKIRGGKNVYQPILFNPTEFPDTMSNICYRPVIFDVETGDEYATTESGEPIYNRSIVETRYDPTLSAGWRWIPNRIRHDKTERLQRGEIARTLNNDKVANSIWNSIHDPITTSMIRTGAEQPTEEESKALAIRRDGDISTGTAKYYDRTAPTEDLMLVRGLRDFHNQYIKDVLLYRTVFREDGPNTSKKLVDVASGKAGDLHRWRKGGVSFVLGVDVSADNIRNPANGAYRRYIDSIIEYGKDRVPPMVFVIGNSSLPIINGGAGATAQERDILRSIFGRYSPEGPLPKAIELHSAGILRTGADVCSCMFALHYFFESESTLNGLIQNISDIVKVGGYFIGCSFDGTSVFELLRTVNKGSTYVGKHGNTVLWNIKKEYSDEEFLPAASSVGLAIDVEFVSIGSVHREYLVSFDYFKERMASVGFYLLDDAKYSRGTGMFNNAYKQAIAEGRRYAMEPAVAEFSFLNRWFVFKRNGPIEVLHPETKVPDAQAVSTLPVSAPSIVEPVSEPLETPVISKVEIDVRPDTLLKHRKFSPAEVFLFHPGASQDDILKIGDIGAGRWMSPTALFPIQDSSDMTVSYPSIEHFLAGMKLKYVAKNPTLARSLMSTEGSIHQKYVGQRVLEGSISNTREISLQKDEISDVKRAMNPSSLGSYGIKKLDESAWISIKDNFLRDALTQRWTRDKRFHIAVEAARNAGKYLLYYIKSDTSELGGYRRVDGTIAGENKVGMFIMEVAGFVI